MLIKINAACLLWIGLIFLAPYAARSESFTLGNDKISRTLTLKGKTLQTTEIINKLTGKTVRNVGAEEFLLRFSDDTGVRFTLSSKDFQVLNKPERSAGKMSFVMQNKARGITVKLNYELRGDDFYMHKYLLVSGAGKYVLERVDLECLEMQDLFEPYKVKGQMTAVGAGKWRPDLGQPLYTSGSALFMGVEFPASQNRIVDGKGYCGYAYGKKLGSSGYESHKAVVGVGDDAETIQDSFMAYIDRIRIRPLRLQIQYNSWFDFFTSVSKEKFAESVNEVNQRLVTERKVPALSAYVIDDGWQDVNKDWSQKTWRVNDKFDSTFASSFGATASAGSKLGLWVSPGLVFNCQKAVDRYRTQGFEVLDKWMSMAGPKYMGLLENRLVELTKSGVGYFKLDGVFGHLNVREFETNGDRYGLDARLEVGGKGLSPRDSSLNGPRFDELKTYYLSAGTERLMEVFKKMHQANPEVYIVISNGAYLSPWWLMYVDTVWMINAGDAAKGANRTDELVYRDGVYFDTWVKEQTQFPLNSVFNHEPKKTATGESKEVFRDYLLMNISRGTGFIELYVKTKLLTPEDWDVMGEGLRWAHKIFPYFKNPKMHGGDPKKREVYGYSGWNKNGGYVSIHNPSSEAKEYTLSFDKKLGLPAGALGYVSVSNPQQQVSEHDLKRVSLGKTLKYQLKPYEIKIVEFVVEK